ncbi:hypothetical protein GLAREA_06695 [Glarea lozoyensis ATCC 20868]|uniref:Small secreted protein n=2 Tax=Glarea lozoyensis TaxID=101852 RepID=S3D5D2_GLAL2|nr:uncharacterized protein GLAREA_06695 [Glarea lozoyensis ATCC 20868]EHK99402.1 hypothetical protein M7I_4698 [Glarea lozoyensis 74030]EPE33682.1 hypothetical protein GLAREA_06695 [Glarea lozoyensis ATCC 20868]
MRFSNTLLSILSLSSAVLAAPMNKRALTVKSYNDFSVSAGVSGDALAEVNANFPIDLNDLASVSAGDLKIISDAAKVSEQAEVATGGFNDALEGVSGDAATALQNGKIKNKVLKLQTDVLRLQIQAAQGKTGLDAQIATQQKKLATNVALDEKAAGQASTAIDFAG